MDGQTDKVTAQECGVFSPNDIDDRRNQRDNGYAQISWPRFFVAYRRKARAVEQSTDGDGREKRHGDGAENGLKLD